MATKEYVQYPIFGGGGGSGVSSLNALTGAITLAAGTNITLTTVGNTITINSTGGGGSGTVTSVGLALPSIFTVTNSPVTTTGTLTGTLNTQTANTVFAGPTTGAAATPTFRALVSADLPSGTGTVTSVSVVSANGLSGTVATATTTPAITLAPTFTGIAYSNGSGFATAVAGNFPTLNQNTTGSAGSVSGTNVITNANLAQIPTLTILGNNTGGTANVSDLTVAQVNAILPVFTATLNGLAPLSGGGTTNFLRADGTWAAPTSGGVTTVGTIDTNANANGLFISGSTISTQSASASVPGMVNLTTQSFAGNKTFTGTVAISPSNTAALTINSTALIFDSTNVALGINGQPQTASSITTVNTSGAAKPIWSFGYGVGSTNTVRGDFARGTLGTPAAAQAGDALNVFSGRGYGTSQFAATSTGNMGVYAGETFTNTSNATYLAFKTTPTGSVSNAEVLRMNSTGNILVATTTDNGISKLQVNGSSSSTSFIQGYTTTATAAGTTTLTVSSTYSQFFTGTTTQTLVLPAANTLLLGQQYLVINNSTGIVTVNANGGGLVQSMAASSYAIFTVTNISSGAGTWSVIYSLNSASSSPLAYWSGYHGNTQVWAGTSTSFVDPTSTGATPAVTQRTGNITVTTATGSHAGINFTPTSSSNVYLVTATFTASTNSTQGSYQLTDGTNVIDTVSTSLPVNSSWEITLTGLYSPGVTSAVNVRIQTASSSSTNTIQAQGSLANPIEWSITQIPNNISGVPISIGAIDTNANSNGLYISGGVISTQSASATNPGMVNTTAQTFAGAKTFSSTVTNSVAPVFSSLTGYLYGNGSSAVTAQTVLNGQSFITSGTTYTTPSNITTNTVFKFTLIGGGGAGGGNPATANEKAGGGGAGGTVILYITGLSPSTGYTIAIGSGGTGVSNANGNAGGSTTISLLSTTYTAGGGAGGLLATASPPAQGGAGGTCTNGTILIPGQPGQPGQVTSATTPGSGGGGNTMFGSGGQSVPVSGTGSTVGNPGTGYGAGGSGSLAGTSAPTVNTGGAGTAGCILVEWKQ